MFLTKMNIRRDPLAFWGVQGVLLSSLLLPTEGMADAFPVTLAPEAPAVTSALGALPWQQNQTGMAYINGHGVERNVILGRHWIHLAAHHDFPLAQYNLGLMFYDGIGGERNPECAQWWLQKALMHSQAGDEIHAMAEQALLTLASQQTLRPLIYRLPTASLCDRLSANPLMHEDNALLAVAGEPEMTASGGPFFSIAWVSQALNGVRQVWSQRPGNVPPSSPVLVVPEANDQVRAPEETPSLETKDEPHFVSPDIEAPQPPIDVSVPIKTKVASKAEIRAPVPSAPMNTRPSTPVATASTLNLGGNPRTASRQHYTIQLGSAATPAGLIASAQRHRLSNYTVYETVRHGRRWYVLVAGEYATQRAARQAIKGLPAAFLTDKPWVRALAQVQAELLPE